MIVQPGDVVTFKGCRWHEPHWEFDCPVVIYEPIKQYSPWGPDLDAMIEDICIGLINSKDLDVEWHENDLYEFNWRGWDVNQLPSFSGQHIKQKVEFYKESDELWFKILETVYDRIEEN